MTETTETPETPAPQPAPPPDAKSFWSRNKGEIGLALLCLYVALLGLGTIGELFNVEWILDLPLFRPPGKY